MTLNRQVVFWIGLVLTALASLASMALRHRVEARNKAFALAFEASAIQQAAIAEHSDLSEALAKLKASGLTMVVLNEILVGEQLDAGVVSLDEVKARYGVDGLSVSQIRAMPAGLDAELAQTIKESGLELLVRLANGPERKGWGLEERLAQAAGLGAIGMLPQGEQVLGFRSQLGKLNDLLKANKMFYAAAEFAKISGDSTMVAKSPENTMRLHAAQAAELDKLSPGAVEERFAKAFGERSIRILMLRPLDNGSAEPLRGLQELTNSISSVLRKEGGSPGTPRPFEEPNVPLAVFLAIGVGLALCAWFVLTELGIAAVAAGAVALLMAAACATQTGRTYIATAGAILLPIAAYQMLSRRSSGTIPGLFLLVAAISLVGGLAVAGLLNSLKFYVRADQFFGVKPAHFLPMLVMAWVLIRGRFDLKSILKQPLTYSSVLIGAVLLGVLGFMLARTGNDSPGAVSGLELQLRSLLEKFLIVRPRTKEFIIGHPALIMGLGIYLWSHRNGGRLMGVAIFLLFVGSIGLTSIVNTMCHLHTPLLVGLARIAVGMALGALFGGLAWTLVRPMLKRMESEAS